MSVKERYLAIINYTSQYVGILPDTTLEIYEVKP